VRADRPADLTDPAKGRYHYQLRVLSGAAALRDADLTLRTVCQANPATIPRLKDGQNAITFESSLLAHASAESTGGPELMFSVPRGRTAVRLYAAAWQASGNPPDPGVRYRIEYAGDADPAWRPVVSDWNVQRRPPEPQDFWSQSFTWGQTPLPGIGGTVRVRFANTANKAYRRVEAHLAYRPTDLSPTTVTYAWKDAAGQTKTASRTYPAGTTRDDSWWIDAGRGPKTLWVEYAAR
jgi:hypothetical protein